MFEYDPAKSDANAAKHGIDFEQAKALWNDQNRFEIRTRSGDPPEFRWAVVGRIGDSVWTAIITYRGETIRLISVRKARDNETDWYQNRRV
jgi:hypothetical protein